MTTHQHAAPTPVGGSLVNAATLVCGVLIAIMAAILLVRFIFGLGMVANINDGYSWGIWVVVDVMIGSALACGGFSVALLVYIFNKGEYHPLVRPALLASLFGYTLAGAGIFVDLGRWWNFWHIFWPGYANPSSVMFEVAVCVTAYILVMWIEFSPVFLEKMGRRDVKKKLNKWLFFFIALGVLLPMMHQSSLGTMLVVMGGQVNPLWQTPAVPLIYLLTAIVIGYGVVLFESCVAAAGYRRTIEMRLLNPLSKIMLGVLAVYLVVRFGDLLIRGALGEAFHPDWVAISFWIENIAFVAPFFLIGSTQARRNPANLFLAGIAIMIGGILLRLNGFLIGYGHFTGSGWTYFPSLAEVMVTVGIFAIEVLGYIIITRRFPVLPREHAQVAS
ncbi:Polysulphide reductase, NrfD [Rhodoferax ferrireducens T118]|uniref:Polysulphide reductase, NrfD n=1 Tax=Albidiferax ferrireducens (strain ATCC BAA-621 / DSM 15236 / T118) TaxID=338969 RepID=Q21R15_ALBFT|nr:Ni/Fe-hydrogenase cytochrome b subunit [Rhodoferax ferrireducens]ABD71788.1 Polysulphide reductase, NrfD [Rhodoferax ferrireducens T118]